MRIVYGERIFEIESVIDWEERNEYLQLMCREVVQGDRG
ncbi:MAG: head-tail adaptor protein [Bacillota bacterium]